MNTISAYIVTQLSALSRDEEGASMVEYGLLVAFIALIAVVGVGLLGGRLNTFFEGLSNRF